MVTVKPKRFSEINPSDWALLADALQEISDSKTFYCGVCKNVIRISKGQDKPNFCTKCGIELDWKGVLPTMIKVCVKCKREFSENTVYCDSDGSKLEERPIKK